MIRKSISGLILLLVSVNILCQDNNTENILNQFSDKFKKSSTITTKFTLYNIDQQDEVSDNFEGEIFIKDNLFKLKFPGNVIISDGKVIWQYVEDLNEVTISEKEEDDESILSNPKKMFTVYKDEFKFKSHNEVTIDGKSAYEIDLFPKELDENSFSRIRLHIEKEGLALIDIKYFSKDANNIFIKINELDLDKPYDDSFFTFNPKEYKDIEVNDMR